MQIPEDPGFEIILDEALGAESHKETEEKLSNMSDEDFVELMDSLIRKTKKKKSSPEAQVNVIPYIA